MAKNGLKTRGVLALKSAPDRRKGRQAPPRLSKLTLGRDTAIKHRWDFNEKMGPNHGKYKIFQ